MIDIREYDVPYHRFLIDTGTRCGWWYKVKVKQGEVTLTHRKDMLARRGQDLRVRHRAHQAAAQFEPPGDQVS